MEKKSPFNDPNWRNKYYTDAIKSEKFIQMLKKLYDQLEKEDDEKRNKAI
jgi:hypothetical protein